MAQTRRERLDRQRERQAKLRTARKSARKPSRDDIARLLLHWSITEMIGKGRERELHRVQDALVERLVAQGFHKAAADAAFDELVDKYAGGWAFQRKVHLQASTGGRGGHELTPGVASLRL